MAQRDSTDISFFLGKLNQKGGKKKNSSVNTEIN